MSALKRGGWAVLPCVECGQDTDDAAAAIWADADAVLCTPCLDALDAAES